MSGNTRVLIVINGAAVGLPFGGAERFGLELALQLDRQRCSPEVLALFQIGSASEEYWVARLAERGVPCHFATACRPGEDCRPGEFGPRYVRALRSIATVLAGRRYGVVHSNSQVGSIASLLYRRGLGRPALLRTAHLPKEWGRNAPFRLLFADLVFPLTFDATAGVSREVCNHLDGRVGARLRGRHTLYIPNAMDFDRFASATVDRAQVLTELGIPAGSLVVGSVGRLTAQKGYDLLLSAGSVLMAGRPDVWLLLVGDGELRAAMEAQAAGLGIAQRVVFAGARPDVDRLLKAMDVFVSSSLWEGLPTVVMEAMAAGVPVVATDIAGTRDLVRHGQTGWLVPAGRPDLLARQVEGALADPDNAASVATAARVHVQQHYSMSAIAERYLGLYQALSEGRNPGSRLR